MMGVWLRNREAAVLARRRPLLLHQPGLSDGRQHERRRRDGRSRGLLQLLHLLEIQITFININMENYI